MKNACNDRRMRYLFYIVLCFTLIISVLLIVRLAAAPNSRVYSTDSAARIYFTGTYELDGQTAQPLTQAPIEGLSGHKILVLRGRFNRNIDENAMLTMQINSLAVELRVNGNLIFSSAASKADSHIWQTFRTSGITENDAIEIRLSGFEENGSGELHAFLQSMIVGSDYASFYQKITSNLPEVLSAGAILILGFLLALTALIFQKARIGYALNLLLFSGFVFFSGLWFFMDYDYFTLFIPYPSIKVAIELLCAGFIPIFAAAYVFTVLKHRSTRFSLKLNLAILLLSQLLNLIRLFAGFTFLSSGMHFFLLLVLMLLSMLNALCCTFYEAKALKNAEAKATFILVVLVFCGIMLDILDYFMNFTEHGYLFHAAFLIALLITIIRMINYVITSMRQARKAAQLENDLLQSRIQVMLSQIKPHFIFNTLNAISALCLTDPLKADETIVLFSEYLRENINALETQASISFEKELHHVRNYARIEQIRFGDKLNVEYRIEFEDFEIPTLTLQPIVENAIRHGIGKKEGSGTVWIRSEYKEGFAVITVQDDGVGFDMNSNYKREDSVGMKNVKTRLECMVHAQMEITSAPGEGTTTILRIPVTSQS